MDVLWHVLGIANSNYVAALTSALNPTIHFTTGDFSRIPIAKTIGSGPRIAQTCVELSKQDWDNSETSWDFRDLPLLRPETKGETLAASWEAWRDQCSAAIRRMQELETENNRLFIEAYGLQDELTPEVPEEQITLARADARGDVAAFLSYAVGCMMGRYSLDKPGLVLADAGDSLAEYLAKVGRSIDALTFEPDADGIIPVLDDEWFEDDIVARTRAFLRVTFGPATLEENLRFIEASLGKELRKYFLADFYKDHLQTYKKRPIYWLFSSGKQRAFQCLVYLHRYNDGTLSRMRTEYVIPLQSRIAARIEQLEDDKLKATSTSHGKKLQKELDDLKKQQTELLAFDERLKHAADKRIVLDLDDGVKVNYGKFGDLLADVKSVTGGSEE
jgi:type II restriction/modification system DNA methylase subunit YeeA